MKKFNTNFRNETDLRSLKNRQSVSPAAVAATHSGLTLEAVIGDAVKSFTNLIRPLLAEAVQEAISTILTNKFPAEPEERLLTVEEAAAFLKVSKSTIHNWKRDGKLPFHTKGKRVFFQTHQLLASLESSTDFR